MISLLRDATDEQVELACQRSAVRIIERRGDEARYECLRCQFVWNFTPGMPDRVHHPCGTPITQEDRVTRVKMHRKALNFTVAITKHLASGAEYCSTAEYEARLGLCDGCIYRSVTDECRACGCGVHGEVMGKASWKSQKCPVGRWPRWDRERDAPLRYTTADGVSAELPPAEGASVILICGGPSGATMRADAYHRLGIDTASVNSVPTVVGNTRYWFCVDHPAKFAGDWWTDSGCWKFLGSRQRRRTVRDGRQAKRRTNKTPSTLFYQRSKYFDADAFFDDPCPTWGLDDKRIDAMGIRGCRSVMLVALRILCDLGYRHIGLIGTEFKMTVEKPYCHAMTADQRKCDSNNRTFDVLNRRFAALEPKLLARGIDVVNCTPESNLTAFPRQPLDEFVKEARCSSVS